MYYRNVLSSLVMVVLFAAGCSEKKETKPAVDQNKASSAIQTKDAERNNVDIKTTKVKLETSMGDIVIELNEKAAPKTVKNFLEYVNKGFYNGTIFHRVIKDFMIQGGGLTADMMQKPTGSSIVNEASNGLKNDRGTIAMARTSSPNSATCQFFINHKNNESLNYVRNDNPGYAVFGKVTQGMNVVDAIASVKTTTRSGMPDVPVEPVVIKAATVLAQ
jgi:cyclophilin family peptidyl-prolyl cis-trans isomerase